MDRDSLRLSLFALVLATVSRGRLGLGAGLLGRLASPWALTPAVRVAFRSSSLAARVWSVSSRALSSAGSRLSILGRGVVVLG